MLATLITLVTFLLLLRAVFHSSSFPDIANLIKSTINKSTVNKQVKLHRQWKGRKCLNQREPGTKTDAAVPNQTVPSGNGRYGMKMDAVVRSQSEPSEIRSEPSEFGWKCPKSCGTVWKQTGNNLLAEINVLQFFQFFLLLFFQFLRCLLLKVVNKILIHEY